jgi:myo-inositol-1(or 4)-monophosphatase
MLRVALGAARNAGEMISRAFRDVDLIKVEEKKANDYVTEVDRVIEEMIVNEIRASLPDHKFLGEEFGESGRKESEYEWIIDPIDGTTNFIRGIPHFAVSIACRKNGRLEHAVVFNPILNEEFTASRGQGAMLNERRIRATKRVGLSGSLLGTGIPFSGVSLEKIDPYLASMHDLLQKKTAGIRRAGAASLDLAYVAAGRLDGYWEMNLKPWDIAAGALIAREAGALVSDLAGGEKFLQSGNILCAPPRVYKEMLPIVSRHLK